MTTDTFPKGADAAADDRRRAGDLNGIAKGSGMIAPDMATMLAFVFTDAAMPAPRAAGAAAPRRPTARSTAITVDGDTSTSDTLLLFATGAARHAPIAEADDPRLADFRAALDEVLIDLAHQIVRDGEGAEKFDHHQGRRRRDRRRRRGAIGLAIANSPLVKTAIAGERRQLGPHRHGGRQVRRAAPSATGSAIAFGGMRIAARRRGRARATTRRRSASPLSGREIAIGVDRRHRAAAGPRCGPAT